MPRNCGRPWFRGKLYIFAPVQSCENALGNKMWSFRIYVANVGNPLAGPGSGTRPSKSGPPIQTCFFDDPEIKYNCPQCTKDKNGNCWMCLKSGNFPAGTLTKCLEIGILFKEEYGVCCMEKEEARHPFFRRLLLQTGYFMIERGNYNGIL